MTMDDDMFAVAVWHRLSIRVPTDMHMPSAPCLFRSGDLVVVYRGHVSVTGPVVLCLNLLIICPRLVAV